MPKDRRSREAEALRANLLKRKAQLRARLARDPKPAESGQDVQEDHNEKPSLPEAIARPPTRR